MRTCEFDGCERRYRARGYCEGHYQQLTKGKPLSRIVRGLPPQERFWAYTEKTDTCWQWMGARNSSGYGSFVPVKGEKWTAHRYAYTVTVGPIPDGMVLDHQCFNKSCVNPSHLTLCTQKQNLENRPSAYSNSQTGVRGVYPDPHGKGFVAQVKHDGKIYYFGSYETIAEAECVVIEKRIELFTNNQLDRRKAA